MALMSIIPRDIDLAQIEGSAGSAARAKKGRVKGPALFGNSHYSLTLPSRVTWCPPTISLVGEASAPTTVVPIAVVALADIGRPCVIGIRLRISVTRISVVVAAVGR